MSTTNPSRRTILRHGLAGAAAGVAASRMTAASCGRTIGANDRIHLALIGCGGRGRYILQNMAKPCDPNIGLVAVCDIWKSHLANYTGEAEKLFGTKPKAYADYHMVLEDADVDAVIIATPDHQHAGQCIDAVRAGKHVYVEKPIIGIAEDLGLLNRWYDIVKAGTVVVQNGTHGVSCPAAKAIKQCIAEGRLGKLFRVESTETDARPYWVSYSGPKTEADTDWKAWLCNRKDRPFDAHLHACWMGYHDITSGTIGGWMSHFINMVHFVTGCDFPVSATAYGGSYALSNDKRCNAPDQAAVLLDYAEGFHTQFTSHFGSSLGNESTVFMFEKGMIRTRFGHWLGNPTLSSEGVNDAIKPEKLLQEEPPYPGAAHVKNWFDCIRNGGQPNANVEFGYKHGIAVVMGDAASTTGRKVHFDKVKREIRS
ncbi:MAG TPA: Gfo/Idh/MocA family oxidoreductase [Phycisphaerae bacterium]|nr:Gfo/Idh/MocA family oxidoreductase [Phycisphaerae bacterium]HRY68297.1 Gfo/Idh/MocA family oxidoreductase [Phycisphaerae bacterium]HSA26820.1 Gfo/Idh/MocA family oxidoreductase [Phycisphaerae bacterium]